MLAVIVDALLVEKIGRRRMTLFGFTGACSGILLMAIVGCFNYENAQLGAVLVGPPTVYEAGSNLLTWALGISRSLPVSWPTSATRSK